MAIDERLIFYEGKHVRLKVLSEQDVIESNWFGWFNNESICAYNTHHYFPNDFERQVGHLKTCSGPDKIQFGIVDRANPEKICGVVSLGPINLVHRHAEIAGTQDKTTQEKPALFFEAWSIVLRHGFEQLGLQKIYGGSFHPQVPGALARAFNFEIEGVKKREVFKNNKFHDLTLVAVFNDTVRYPEL